MGAHQTAYNRCYSLWNRAKKNIHAARAKAAAPMKHTDVMVKGMFSVTKKCAGLMKKADTDCKTAFDKYKSACKAKMQDAMDETFTQVQDEVETAKAAAKAPAVAKKGASKKIAKKAAADSKAELKAAKHELKKETASPKMKKAIVKCELKKNVAKRTCITAVHVARDSCDKLTSSGLDDNDTSEEFMQFLQ